MLTPVSRTEALRRIGRARAVALTVQTAPSAAWTAGVDKDTARSFVRSLPRGERLVALEGAGWLTLGLAVNAVPRVPGAGNGKPR